jgi:hypothetical protein
MAASRRGGKRPPAAAEQLVHQHWRCGWCGRDLRRDREQFAIIADSTVIDQQDAALDGRRLVAACCRDHLAQLEATAPPWCDEELWSAQLARAAKGHDRSPPPLEVLARRAGLSIERARRAVEWRQARVLPYP